MRLLPKLKPLPAPLLETLPPLRPLTRADAFKNVAAGFRALAIGTLRESRARSAFLGTQKKAMVTIGTDDVKQVLIYRTKVIVAVPLPVIIAM
jgi:hypothetical protein